MQEVKAILPLGSIVGERYVVEDWLGKGGFGAVYLVRDLRVKHNLFALKEVIDPDKKERNRFLFEAELLKRFDHHALARVYRVFDDDAQNRAYMLMDYIEGPNLETLRQQQPDKRFSFSQVLTIMAPIMEAVDYLHSQQPPIIHRDIKPSNIIVPEAGDEAVLVDFGVAKEYNPDATTTAVRRCSPGYAAPEQYGKGSSIRTDIYELGATLYSLLTGKIPVDALTRMSQVGDGDDDPLESLNEVVPTVPLNIARAIHRAMSIKSNERFPTVEDFWQALNARPTWRQFTVMSPPNSLPPVISSPPPLVAPDQLPPLLSQIEGHIGPTTGGHKVLHSSQPHIRPCDEGGVAPALVSTHTRPQISRSKKLLALVLFLLAVLIGFGLETGLWSYLINLRANNSIAVTSKPSSTIAPTFALSPTTAHKIVSPTAHPTKAPTARSSGGGVVNRVPPPTPIVVATQQPTIAPTPYPKPTPTPVPPPPPTPTPVSYPNVAASYNGSIDDTTENITTSMALSIQQKSGQSSISGNFTVGPALLGSGPFRGSVTTTKYIQFTVQSYQGNAPLFFYGQVHSDGSLSGNYCSMNAQNQCDAKAGDAGTWNVARSSSAHTSLSSESNSLQNAYNRWPDGIGITLGSAFIIFFTLSLLLFVLYRIRIARSRLHQQK